MKRILCTALALLLTLTAIPFLSACSNKRADDYLKGDEIVIDNELPYIYDPEQHTIVTFQREDGTKSPQDVFSFANACEMSNFKGEGRFTYKDILKYYGNKPIRMLESEKETLYYTVYSLDDNTLCYIYFEKEGDSYILTDCFQADARDDVLMTDMTYPHDLPSAILGDKLPAHCYLDFYDAETILENNLLQWEHYYSACNHVNIPHATLMSSADEKDRTFIRCMQRVSFDIMRDNKSHDGFYVYDLLLEEDGGGTLYFYHLDDRDFLPDNYTYRIIQQETIPLTAEEGTALKALLTEWDFMNQPTWNPEEYMGMDGTTTYIYATGIIGGEDKRYGSNLIVMWEPTSRNAHYHIRTAIEDLVRAHVTVEEGRIYRKDLYEEYDWMQ